jgi:Domain of unknown function (DUF1931)
MLPELFGGLSVAHARTLRVIDPKLTNPTTFDWEQSFALFRLISNRMRRDARIGRHATISTSES